MTTFTAVSYIKVGGASMGTAFGPEFLSEDAAWRWLHNLGDTPCHTPPHDYIEVETASGF
jgi:hypothetical protein